MASTESKTDAVAEHGDVAQIEAGSLPGHEKINISGVTAVHRNEIPEGYYKSWTFIGTFAAICINSACAYASFGFPTNLLSIINEDLGPNPNYVWISLVWTTSSTVVFAVGGRLSDLFGRRWYFIVGNVLGFIGSIFASQAQTIPQLIGASVFIGLAAGVQQMWPMAVDELVPNRDRGIVNAIVWLTALPFSVFSPVIARSLYTNTAAGWRGCYYIAMAMSVTATVLFFVFYHPPTFQQLRAAETRQVSKLQMLDIGGLILLSSGLVCFLLGISWGGNQYPWKSGQVIGCIVGGVALLAAFGLYEVFHEQPYPLIPMRLFTNLPYMGYIISAALITLNYYNISILWPMQSAVVYPTSIVGIGWLSTTTGGGALLGDLVACSLIRPLPKHRWQTVFYAVMGTIFTAGLAATDSGSRSMAVAFVILSCFAVGAIEAMAYTLAPLLCAPEDIGLALGVMLTARTFIPSISTAIYLSVLGSKLSTNIPKYVIPAATNAGLPASELPGLITGLGTGNFSGIAGITPGIISASTVAYQTAYTKTFKLIYLSTIAWGGAGIIFSLFSANMEAKLDDTVERRLHGKEITALTDKAPITSA